jgi:Mitochondrial K+-H+ exchange-related
VKIYWLWIDQERFFFYSNASEWSDDEAERRQADDSETSVHTGLGAWVYKRFRQFSSAWQHADKGALHWMRQAWDWLHTLTRPDEPMLARLRPARRIDLHHPATRGSGEVRADWHDYLKRQWWRHLVWMSVNGVIAPVSVILAVLPGPNLIGYWFAYRAIHHSLVIWGIGRVLREKVPVEFHPRADLDRPIDHDDQGVATHVALNGSTAHLGDHVAWWRRWGRWMPPWRGRSLVASRSSGPPSRPESP